MGWLQTYILRFEKLNSSVKIKNKSIDIHKVLKMLVFPF